MRALGTQALHGNPYDGHTLQGVLKKAESLNEITIEQVFVDKGYKGHGVEDKQVFISGQRKGVTRWIKGQLKRRQAIRAAYWSYEKRREAWQELSERKTWGQVECSSLWGRS